MSPHLPDGDPRKVTISGKPADPTCVTCVDTGAPQPIDPATGMHRDYWVLSEEERSKGFVRPVRRSYRHVGLRPTYPTRELTAEESKRNADYGYVAFEPYPPGGPVLGRFWTRAQLASGCGQVTTMGLALSETYARDPSFYGATLREGNAS